MFTLRRPTDDAIRAFLDRQASRPWSYDFVGITRAGDPKLKLAGWNIDRQRVLVGHGQRTFAAACAALSRWQMFPPQIAELCWPDRSQEPGSTVGVLYWALPIVSWTLFAARVVYAIEEPHRRGFAYGTLPDHLEAGEERFLVEWNETDDTVWYDLYVVSRPAHWLSRLGYPFSRYEQARFRRLSGAALQAAVK